jgi:hypothetical protein
VSVKCSFLSVYLEVCDGIWKPIEVVVAEIHSLHLNALPNALPREGLVSLEPRQQHQDNYQRHEHQSHFAEVDKTCSFACNETQPLLCKERTNVGALLRMQF